MSEVRDIYSNRVEGKRTRARGCTHHVPCPTFRCTSPDHRGRRRTPWCAGHDCDEHDPEGEFCDHCWFIAARRAETKKARVA